MSVRGDSELDGYIIARPHDDRRGGALAGVVDARLYAAHVDPTSEEWIEAVARWTGRARPRGRRPGCAVGRTRAVGAELGVCLGEALVLALAAEQEAEARERRVAVLNLGLAAGVEDVPVLVRTRRVEPLAPTRAINKAAPVVLAFPEWVALLIHRRRTIITRERPRRDVHRGLSYYNLEYQNRYSDHDGRSLLAPRLSTYCEVFAPSDTLRSRGAPATINLLNGPMIRP